MVFKNDFKTVLPAYLKLKDALIASDASQTSMDANATLEILKKLDLSDVGTMGKAHINKSIEMLEAIAKKEDLENPTGLFCNPERKYDRYCQ